MSAKYLDRFPMTINSVLLNIDHVSGTLPEASTIKSQNLIPDPKISHSKKELHIKKLLYLAVPDT